MMEKPELLFRKFTSMRISVYHKGTRTEILKIARPIVKAIAPEKLKEALEFINCGVEGGEFLVAETKSFRFLTYTKISIGLDEENGDEEVTIESYYIKEDIENGIPLDEVMPYVENMSRLYGPATCVITFTHRDWPIEELASRLVEHLGAGIRPGTATVKEATGIERYRPDHEKISKVRCLSLRDRASIYRDRTITRRTPLAGSLKEYVPKTGQEITSHKLIALIGFTKAFILRDFFNAIQKPPTKIIKVDWKSPEEAEREWHAYWDRLTYGPAGAG